MRSALVGGLVAIACSGPPTVEIYNDEGSVVLVEVEVARSAAARRQGLMGATLEPGSGLLIELPIEDEVCIINEGVPIAIDAVFIREHLQVEALESFAAGEGPTRCHSARWVLEVDQGVAADVRMGDRAHLSL